MQVTRLRRVNINIMIPEFKDFYIKFQEDEKKKDTKQKHAN